MRNPWLKKNPLLSMWLSGANAVLGAARGRAATEAQRQTRIATAQATKAIVDFWTGKQAPKRRRRRK